MVEKHIEEFASDPSIPPYQPEEFPPLDEDEKTLVNILNQGQELDLLRSDDQDAGDHQSKYKFCYFIATIAFT